MQLADKDVLSQTESWTLVGGRPVWDELKLHYGDLLRPFRIVGKQQQFLKEVIRTTLRAAQLDGKLRDPQIRANGLPVKLS